MMKSQRLAIFGLLTLAVAGSAHARCTLEPTDRQAVIAASEEYVNAWLANDPERVGNLLTEDVVLLPHHGVMPRVGKDAVMGWWFPSGEVVAPVTRYELAHDESVEGCGDMAIVRGRTVILEYEYEGTTFSNADGNFLTVFRRGEDGAWRISHRIWNDPITRQN